MIGVVTLSAEVFSLIVLLLLGLQGASLVGSKGVLASLSLPNSTYCDPTASRTEYVYLSTTAMELGDYMRVHPSGDFVLFSGNGSPIVDLRQRDAQGRVQPRLIRTPLNAEAYAAEGSWKFVTSPRHGEGMKFFLFEDLVREGESAQPPVVSDCRERGDFD